MDRFIDRYMIQESCTRLTIEIYINEIDMGGRCRDAHMDTSMYIYTFICVCGSELLRSSIQTSRDDG